MPIYVDANGLTDFRNYFAATPARAAQALSLAINDTMRRELLPLAKKTIMAEVALPTGYLDANNRLDVTQFSTPTQLVGIVAGRDRPTSLAQFATSDEEQEVTSRGKATGRYIRRVTGVRVKADGPVRTDLPGAFLIDLKRGSAATGNVGLAIRLRPGETVKAVQRFNPVEIYPNVYILYGPSVDQIFAGVSGEIAPQVMDYLDQEFTRQFVRLGNG